MHAHFNSAPTARASTLNSDADAADHDDAVDAVAYAGGALAASDERPRIVQRVHYHCCCWYRDIRHLHVKAFRGLSRQTHSVGGVWCQLSAADSQRDAESVGELLAAAGGVRPAR